MFIVGEITFAPNDGAVLLRSWMNVFNAVIACSHAAVLAVLIAATRMRQFSQHRGLRRTVLACLTASATCSLAMALSPWAMAPGPWPANSNEVATLRLLVFVPIALRTVAAALLSLALLRGGQLSRWRGSCAMLASAIDLALVTVSWATTPIAIFATLHPRVVQPLAMIPFFAAIVLSLVVGNSHRSAPAS